ncbi:MAG: D-sedoheptulose 7-phosphate isomerase [Deferribacteraceae bacterium]|jgi:D-sedoheptulose 7-phosphate isomerase|nr:D-sedoheptulose 7-phosphate isomerase [Deferribacteraceae bacterium]
MTDKIKLAVKGSIAVKERILNDDKMIAEIKTVTELVVNAYKNGCKILVAGNGGSAADAQHFAAEFVGRFYYDRPSLPAIALTTDTSILTAIGNDYGYNYIFSRQVEGYAKKGDILFAISTSGNSPSIINAINAAKKIGVAVVGLTGGKPSEMDHVCDYIFKTPSEDTPRIQEGHALIEHIICQLSEEILFPTAF